MVVSMRRGLWLGVVWFGSAVSLGGFVWIVAAGRSVFAAALFALVLFVARTWFPLLYVRIKVWLVGEAPTSHGRWTEYEVAVMMFSFLVGAVPVIVGIEFKRIVPASPSAWPCSCVASASPS